MGTQRGLRKRTDTTMKRVAAIAACGLALSACSSMPGLDFLPKGTPAGTTVQFESIPPGAEARVSAGGAACRTPCAMPVASEDFTVTFTLAGYQPQTVPVRISPSAEPIDPDSQTTPAPRLAPNPVTVELTPAAAAPTARKKAPAKAKKTAAPRP